MFDQGKSEQAGKQESGLSGPDSSEVISRDQQMVRTLELLQNLGFEDLTRIRMETIPLLLRHRRLKRTRNGGSEAELRATLSLDADLHRNAEEGFNGN